MAIYIKDMEMPKNCGECKFHRPFYHTQFCMILDKNCSPWKEQKAWCPLTEVPEPHGRLIDADACIDYIRNNNQQAWEALAYAPTVIERGE